MASQGYKLHEAYNVAVNDTLDLIFVPDGGRSDGRQQGAAAAAVAAPSA